MTQQKRALITGITGQDGTYLAQFLLDKGYDVHGMERRASLPRRDRLSPFLHGVTLHHGEMTDGSSLIRLIDSVRPDEVYNLAAQSDVAIGFASPEFTGDTNGLGTLRLLEAIRILGLQDKTRFFQASSSEIFGNAVTARQNEDTPFQPCSPYATAKLYAYWITVNYREAYNIHASNGILFNHESPLRGDNFVTQKICKAAAAIHKGEQETLILGNLDAMRDWGHVKDYVAAMWQMMQQEVADDYVIATGQTTSVREFATLAFAFAGIHLTWEGKGAEEVGIDRATGKIRVAVSPDFYRPVELHALCGDTTKIKDHLGWEATTSLNDLIADMMTSAMAS